MTVGKYILGQSGKNIRTETGYYILVRLLPVSVSTGAGLSDRDRSTKTGLKFNYYLFVIFWKYLLALYLVIPDLFVNVFCPHH